METNLSQDQLQKLIDQKYNSHLQRFHVHTDQLFAILFCVQWVAAIIWSVLISPVYWNSDEPCPNFNLCLSIYLGGFLLTLPCFFIINYSGRPLTRHIIAIAQMLFSAMFIHLNHGRIETHFHIFGSLAFLAFYRDWRVLITATQVVIIDHLVRGIAFPQSVYGLEANAIFRTFEHAGWIIFENIFLIYACYRSQKEMKVISAREVELEQLNESIERKIQLRTQELETSEAHMHLWKTAFDVARDAVVISRIDPKKNNHPTIIYINPAFTSITGYTPLEMIGKTPRMLQGPKTDMSTKDRINEAINQLKPIRAEMLNYRKDGSEFWVELDISPIKNENNIVTHWISIQRDVTERKQAEAELLDSREKLSLLASELEEKTIDLEFKNNQISQQHELAISASKAKSEFLANMSHEIRTPLTAILGFTDLLLGDGDIEKAPPRRIEHINTIKRNGEHLLGVLNDILDLSKIEADKLQIESIVCEPVVVVRDALELMKVRADSKSIKLDVKWSSQIPAKFNSDPMRLKQILVNLIGNAIKFTEIGGVTLHVNYSNEYLEFAVVDTGIGMTPEQTVRIFEAFQQADSSMSRKFGGTGLGLIISKRLANLMKGDVELVYSNMGSGTCFRLYIHVGQFAESELITPQLTSETSAEINRLKKETAKNANQLQGLRILYAEDGIDNQRLISFMMKKQGAEIDIAENGALALDLFEKSKLSDHPYDLILMDMQMPVMDGYQAAAKLRENGDKIPVIALTAHAMSGEREKCIEAGCSDYTTKPIKKEELIGLILKLTQQAEVNV